jgi:hypothetical protein
MPPQTGGYFPTKIISEPARSGKLTRAKFTRAKNGLMVLMVFTSAYSAQTFFKGAGMSEE